MRVLIVEDEQRMANLIRHGLLREGPSADVADRGELALVLGMAYAARREFRASLGKSSARPQARCPTGGSLRAPGGCGPGWRSSLTYAPALRLAAASPERTVTRKARSPGSP